MNLHTCYILSSIKYGDRDAVVKAYSVQTGFQSYFVKGAFGSKSKYKSYIFPFNEVEITVKNEKPDQILPVTKIELIHSSYDDANVLKSSVLLFCSDFLSHILRTENASVEVYAEITMFLSRMEQNPSDAHLYLLFHMLRYNGLLPLVSNGTYLNPEVGEFTNDSSGYAISEPTSLLWKKMIQEENSTSMVFTREQRTAFLESMIQYYQIHFSNFKIPKSYQVLKDLFS